MGSIAMTLMIYGAYGYTGELIAREALQRGLHPILAGRDPARLEPLARELKLAMRAFPVEAAHHHMQHVTTLLNCAGPFSQTAIPLLTSCLANRAHYVDITGEIPVFAYAHRLDLQARNAGIIFCPGAGFDVVPTDCLAATLAAQKPDAVSLNLAFSFGTKPSIGTVKTAIEGFKQGGLIRQNHALKSVPDGYRRRYIPFPHGKAWAATVPFGDVYTAGVSTNIPNIMIYAATPRVAGVMMRMMNPLRPLLAKTFVQKSLTKLAARAFTGGPDSQARTEQRTSFWGEVIDAAGHRLALSFTAPNVYALTVDTALEIATYCSSPTGKAGFYTPSMLMGAGFILGRPGVTPMVQAPP